MKMNKGEKEMKVNNPDAMISVKIDELVENHDRLSKSLQKQLDLTSSAVVIMELLGNDKLSLKELTEKSTLDKSTLSRQVNQLVKKNFVIRETGKDKRFVQFFVTEEGKALHEKYITEKTNQLASILLSWTDEEKQLLYVLLGRLGRSLGQLGK